ncbi:MAG: hypothetical protein P8011_07555 [Acidihalobacter sp.]|uniref:hypothetical protein n=1 Tax=Acidihalobacter sp. TaxID=1872108 RepID=UPI00307F5C98
MHVELRTPAVPENIGLASYRVSTLLGIAAAATIRNQQIRLAGIPRTGMSGVSMALSRIGCCQSQDAAKLL